MPAAIEAVAAYGTPHRRGIRYVLVGSIIENFSSRAYSNTEQAIKTTNKVVADLIAARFA